MEKGRKKLKESSKRVVQNNNLELNLHRGLLAGAELICQQILSLINKYKTGQNCLKKKTFSCSRDQSKANEIREVFIYE